MNQFAQIISRKPGSMCVTLLDPSMLDLTFFSRSPKTDWTLSCLVRDTPKGELLYSTEQLIPLSDFLEETVFTRKEAYQFLSSLLEKLIFTSRTHALLLDLDGIYVSPLGDEFWFAPLPVSDSILPLLHEQKRQCLKSLGQAMQMPGIYEIFGYLSVSMRDKSMSLPEVLCGLQDLESQFEPHSFLERFRPAKGYKRKVPAQARYTDHSMHSTHSLTLSKERQLEVMEQRTQSREAEDFSFRQISPSSSSLSSEALLIRQEQGSASAGSQKTADPGMKTEVIGAELLASGSLELDGVLHPIQFETTEIGRHISCTIQLNDPSVSLHHAKITCDQGRCYLTSLGSTNGTYLNNKKVIRRMRLREGMELRFGNTLAVFHE